MSGDIDLSGFVFTREEWLELEEELRNELLDAADLPFLPPHEFQLLAPVEA